MRAGLIFLGWLWALAVIQGAVAMRVLEHLSTPLNPGAARIVVDVPAGASLNQIAHILAQRGVIQKPRLFSLAARLLGQGRHIRSGEYYVSASQSPLAMLKALTVGRPVLHKVTFPEGSTAAQVARILDQAGLCPEARFLAAARDTATTAQLGIPASEVEGYLFPDTYHLPKGLEPQEIMRLMVRRFRAVWRELNRQPSLKAEGCSPHQIVIMASLIQAEAKVEDEMPLIAAVFFNRLEKGMLLQCDPTVIYGLEDFEGRLHKNDLNDPHPYNTYVHSGLPPGPIGNPGAQALRAALNPAAADYLYFVSRNDGTHQFSQTYAQHRRAVTKYQKQ